MDFFNAIIGHASGFFAQIDAGGEFFRTSAASANTGLSFGWEF